MTTRRLETPTGASGETTAVRAGTPVRLDDLLESWVKAGIVSAEQAREMALQGDGTTILLSRRHDRDGSVSLATEALGYLGGVVTVVSALLIAQLYWAELTTAVRVVVVGGVAVSLLAAGAAVPSRLGGVGIRLRSALWLAATAAIAGLLTLVAGDVLDLSGADTAVVTSLGTAAAAGALWTLHRELPQQVATMVALMVSAGAVAAHLSTAQWLPGMAAWAVAGLWLGLGWNRMLPPRQAVVPVSATAMVIGAMTMLPTEPGLATGLVTAAGLVVLAVLSADLALLAIGSVGTLVFLPAAMTEWFPDSSAAPFVLMALGLVLVGSALWTARRRRRRSPGTVTPDRVDR